MIDFGPGFPYKLASRWGEFIFDQTPRPTKADRAKILFLPSRSFTMSDIKPVEPANIPTVDFKLLSQGTQDSRKAALKQLDDAFRTCGFIYLSNHSIGQDLVDEALSWVSTATH